MVFFNIRALCSSCVGFLHEVMISLTIFNAVGKTTMGGALGTVQGFASLGQVAGLVLAGPLYQLGGSHYPFGFGASITFILLFVVIVLRRRPTTNAA